MTSPPDPDWVAWLARAEAEACGDDDDGMQSAPHVMVPGQVPTWRKLADLLPNIIAGAIGGALILGLAGEALYFGRLFW